MFSRVKKYLGAGLVLIGFLFAIGIAGTDDVHTLQGIHDPILPTFVTILIALAVMAVGVVLIGGESDESAL